MKLFIPDIGTKLILTSPWVFELYDESRNDKLIKELRTHTRLLPQPKPNEHGIYNYYGRNQKLCDFTMPTGTKLSVQRVYIRVGAKDYSSISFSVNLDVVSTWNQKTKTIKARFWAKLPDVNRMEVDIITTAGPNCHAQ